VAPGEHGGPARRYLDVENALRCLAPGGTCPLPGGLEAASA